MKKALSVVVLLLFLRDTYANTYYSVNNTSPNLTSSWRTNRNGTGFSPSNFSTSNDIFIVQAGHTITTTANWTISGNNAKIIVENGAILKANHKITIDIFQLYDGGKYTHNDNSSSIPGSDNRLIAPNSTIEINDWTGNTELPGNTTWGNLIIDMPGYNSNINQTGDLTDIAGDFIIRSTGNTGKEFRLAGSQDYVLTIGGNLIIEGGILEASSGNSNADQSIIINGSFLQSGGTFMRSNNNLTPLLITFNGTNSAFTRSSGTLSNTNINWRVNAGKKLTLNNDLPVALLRSLTVAGTLSMGNKIISGLGAFTVNTGGTLINGNTLGLPGTLSLTGLLTFNSGASYEFLSATTTPFPTILASVSAANITIGANVTLNKNVTVSGILTLNGGKATIPAGNTLTVSSGNAVAGSGFDASKHIVTQVNTLTGTKGYFRIQNFTGTRTIPVGNGTYYLPVTLTATGTNDFSICAFNGVTTNGQPNGTVYTSLQKKDVVDAVWHVNRNAGTSSVMMNLAWPAALEGSSFQNISNGQIGISHYGTNWESALGSGNQVANTAMRSAIVSFSPFSVRTGTIPLPLNLGDIKAIYKSGSVQIDWFSLTEANLDHYEIERSTDAHNFTTAGRVIANGNSVTRNDYSWRDNVSNDGIFFYRVKAVDADLKSTYSTVVKINISQQSSSSEIIIYPNPVAGKKISLQTGYLIAGTYQLIIHDQAGRGVQRQTVTHTGGTLTQQLTLTSSFPGLYTLVLTDDRNTKIARSFVVN